MNQQKPKSAIADRMRSVISRIASGVVASAVTTAAITNLSAGTATYDFSTDPTLGGALQVGGNGANTQPWVATGGNPGGFLALTYPVNSMFASIVFPDIDGGKIVSSFVFETDLRVGNSTGDRAADGFSISFARDTDPIFASLPDSASNMGNWAGGIAEGGSTSGIAIDFDTWSGNTLPDGGDVEGIIVRVDNVTVLKYDMPTRHGDVTDATSLQTGPRTPDYWANSGDPLAPDSWSSLKWAHLKVEVDANAKLTVTYKGKVILNGYQTSYFPGPGRLVLAGRTGGANENTHFDNISLTTTAAAADTVAPTAPGKINVALAGARRVDLNWAASTDNSGRVAYQVSRDGTKLGGLITTTNYTDLNVAPGKSYKYSVIAQDVSQNKSAASEATVTTATETQDIGFLSAEIYDGISGTPVQNLLDSADFPANPSRVRYVNGITFGEPNFGDTYGDNLGVRIAGTITPVESGNYDFFVRSDDASQLFLNTAGATLPNPAGDAPIAEETGCCNSFKEPGDPKTTASPIALVAGKSYGFVFLVKEGGGGDWGQVAWRKVGDATPADRLPAIQGTVLKGVADGTGGSIAITAAPKSISVPANEPAQFNVIANTSSPYSTAVLYQWYKNGTPIAGANGASYKIAAASTADNGAKYKVLIAIPGVSTTSDEATLTVTADTKKPTVFLVDGDDSLTSATVTFSEEVKAPSATTASNYSFGGGLTVSSATQVNARTVKLVTSKQTEGTAYTLTVNNVQDAAGNAAAAATGTLTSWAFTKGKAKYEVWTGIGGVDLQTLKDLPTYPNSPDLTEVRNVLEGRINWADNYGAKLSAFIVPPADGDYVFFVSGDDHIELYLSTDDKPANKKLIAKEPEWNDPRQWVLADRRDATSPQNRSDKFAETEWPGGNKITLKGNTRYYLEGLVKEGGGGDSITVTAKAASAADPANGDPSLNPAYFGALAPALPGNVLSATDAITPSSSNSPAAEIAKNVLDGKSSTKYLNFDKLKTGFTVTPAAGATIISGISITTANDAPERDPASFEVWGSNDGVFYELVGSGSITTTATRFASSSYGFANTNPYTSYKVVFPTVVDAAKANSMQVADVGLLGVVVGGAPAVTPTLGVAVAGGKVTLTYVGTLQSADTVNGTYSDVAGATSPFVVTATSNKFYRTRN